MDKIEELKDCPFCGEQAFLIWNSDKGPSGNSYTISCKGYEYGSCFAITANGTQEQVSNMWNNRYQNETSVKGKDAIKKEIEAFANWKTNRRIENFHVNSRSNENSQTDYLRLDLRISVIESFRESAIIDIEKLFIRISALEKSINLFLG